MHIAATKPPTKLTEGRVRSGLEAQPIVAARQEGDWSWCVCSQERKLSADHR